MAQRHQVLIVGGGPVGVALAVILGRRGISCAVIERRIGLSNIPKGQNLTHRTLEHFYFWGLADHLRAARTMPQGYPIGEILAYDNLKSGYWHAPAGRELVGPYFFQKNERLPQYCMEEVLRKKMEDLPAVETRFGWRADSVSQTPDAVKLTITNETTNKTETLEADYLVGCDGGHSMVRNAMGIERGGTDFDELMVLAVFRSKELHEGLSEFPPRSTYRVMHPDLKGYWKFFGRIDVGEGWFYHAPVPKDTTRDNFDFQALIQEAAGFTFKCDFDHVGFWDLKVAVAERYREGRVFIAGDAAHSHPPYGGFGLNNGLEDAVNLGWKLIARFEGWGSDALLDTYGSERRPVFRDVAEDFIADRIRQEREFLERYNPARNKEEFERAWKEREHDLGTRVRSYEPHYEGSSIVFGPTNGACSAHGKHMLKARAGHHLAPQSLSNGRNVYEELGPDFTLLAFDCDDVEVQRFSAAAAARDIPLAVVRDSFKDERVAYEAKVILVRPDQHVAWTGNAVPDNADDILRRAVAR